MSRNRNTRKRKKSPIFILFIATAVLALALIGGAAAKYIYSNNADNILASKGFYFNSNLLVKGGEEYTINSTATEIPITLFNYQDSLNCADDNITYTISVDDDSAKLDNGDLSPAKEKNGTLTGNGTTFSSNTITLKGITSGKTYTVTATGTAGYTKTISATFKVADIDENVYKHLDTSNPAYVVLTVWTDNVAGDLIVDYDKTGLIPDNTDPVLQSITNYNAGTYEGFTYDDTGSFSSPYSSRKYRFFKDGAISPTVGDFTVEVDGHIADPGTP